MQLNVQLSILLLLTAMVLARRFNSGLQPVDLRTIDALTFIDGETTASIRGKTFPSLVRTGGTTPKGTKFAPSSIQCTNVGTDDRNNVNWRCSAQLPQGVELGRFEIICEGWSGPSDSRIVPGSCNIEYELNGRPAKGKGQAKMYMSTAIDDVDREHYFFPIIKRVVMIVLTIFVVRKLIRFFKERRRRQPVSEEPLAPPSAPQASEFYPEEPGRAQGQDYTGPYVSTEPSPSYGNQNHASNTPPQPQPRPQPQARYAEPAPTPDPQVHHYHHYPKPWHRWGSAWGTPTWGWGMFSRPSLFGPTVVVRDRPTWRNKTRTVVKTVVKDAKTKNKTKSSSGSSGKTHTSTSFGKSRTR
ncbi:hypothetical protein J8273_6318 [Carpediemonas membranifera]|uniref:Store-operated calcium entry-associated regulatory factor n=1 Tax=Carpediemonas membranifera TaxID=201153 RepID=A0A8J6E023_9EUKA|nr:hypothetical protein J8273_6318 [Carpediemonas membranifera]|eukprot:KAG9391553.1 hypothetical protein J8273_6318 [Carpediemonas membranifera]